MNLIGVLVFELPGLLFRRNSFKHQHTHVCKNSFTANQPQRIENQSVAKISFATSDHEFGDMIVKKMKV